MGHEDRDIGRLTELSGQRGEKVELGVEGWF